MSVRSTFESTTNLNYIRDIQIGVVIDNNDPDNLGRIKVSIPGPANKGGDKDMGIDNIPWCFPLLQQFVKSIPKVGEAVFIFYPDKYRMHSYRLYIGPIIPSPANLDFAGVNTTALLGFDFSPTIPRKPIDSVPALNGVFSKIDDVVIQGRKNTDIILRDDEILIRSGKLVNTVKTENNPYGISFNTTNPAYIQIKNNIDIGSETRGTALNIVANKINLLTHSGGTPRYNLANQKNQFDDADILNAINTAHPIPFGDLLLEYLRLLKNAFLNHVHRTNGSPSTDLTVGGQGLFVKSFKDKADDLENRMLSKNIRIN